MNIDETILLFVPVMILAAMLVRQSAADRRARVRLPTTDKLLRGPGESTRNQLEALNERVLCLLAVVMLAASVFATAGPRSLNVLSWAVYLTLIFGGCARIFALASKASDYRLGLSGERAVAEELNQLMREGCHVFHDFPKPDRTNIDHIVIAPTGVYAIETKIQRSWRTYCGTRPQAETRFVCWPRIRESGEQPKQQFLTTSHPGCRTLTRLTSGMAKRKLGAGCGITSRVGATTRPSFALRRVRAWR